ncbi:heme transporter FLVCR2-like [Haliotis asinina]|uniref:heme transporter FLVCR2-like n=1 Tax=Haliotis asinina TaxID=109174 RepID=UPI0035323900
MSTPILLDNMGQSSGKRPSTDPGENGSANLLPTTPTSPTTPTTPGLTDHLQPTEDHPQVYRSRWLMLALFSIYSFSSAFQWIHINIIANVILRFYNESLPEDAFQRETAIDWLSMLYMLAYIVLVIPATWVLDKKGLRICHILGSLLNAIGAWIKCASVSGDRFAVLMFAQTICACAQMWVIGIPARLAAVWFGPNEVSTATSIGVFGNQVGVAAGFLLPPEIVPNSDSLDDVGRNLSIMFYGTAAFTTLLFIAIVVVLKDAPPKPPSRAQMLAVEASKNEDYLSSLFRLLKNPGFIILTISYGINTGSYYAISTLLNAVVLYYYEGQEQNAGRIGLTIVLAGVLGSVVAGIWLDKTKTFKGTSLAIYILSMVGMVVFTFTMNLGHIWIVFLTAGSLGFFMTGYLPVGFEFAAEITFPEGEGTSSGLLNASAQFFGIIFTIGMRAMMNRFGVLAGNLTLAVALLVGSIMTAFIKADYRRQKAGKEFFAKLDNIEIEVRENNDVGNTELAHDI